MSGATRAPPSSAWTIALLLAAAHMLSFVDRSILSLAFGPITAEFGISDAALGLLQGTAFALLYGVAAIPFGWLVDRVDPIRVAFIGILVWSAATAAGGLATSYQALFGTRLLVGLGEAALAPAAMAILAARFPPHKLGRAIALFTGGASLGRGVAMAGGGLLLALLTAHGGLSLGGTRLAPWRGMLILLILPGILLAGLLLLVRTPTPAHLRAEPTPGPLPAGFWLHLGGGAAILFVSQSLIAWSPTLLSRLFAIPLGRTGLLLGTMTFIVAPLGHLLGGLGTDLLRSLRREAAGQMVMIASLVATAASLWGLRLSSGSTAALLWLGASFLFATMGAPAALAGLQHLIGARGRGRATALFLGLTTLIGAGCGPFLTGLIADMRGGRAAIATALPLSCSLAAAVGMVCLGIAIRKKTWQRGFASK